MAAVLLEMVSYQYFLGPPYVTLLCFWLTGLCFLGPLCVTLLCFWSTELCFLVPLCTILLCFLGPPYGKQENAEKALWFS
jgi:hypothetical protein